MTTTTRCIGTKNTIMGTALLISLAMGCSPPGVETSSTDGRNEGQLGGRRAVCGDGECDGERGENGVSCGQDCCDETTACDVTYRNQTEGAMYCRSMQGGPYDWYSPDGPSGYNTYCQDAAQIGTSFARCAATDAVCASPDGAPHWYVFAHGGTCAQPLEGNAGVSFFTGRNCTGLEVAFYAYANGHDGALVASSSDGGGCQGPILESGTAQSRRDSWGACSDFGGDQFDVSGNPLVIRIAPPFPF